MMRERGLTWRYTEYRIRWFAGGLAIGESLFTGEPNGDGPLGGKRVQTFQLEPIMAVEFVMRRRIHFSETDRAGVLYFAHYYRFMEEAEHAFWRSLGVAVVMDVAGLENSWPRVATSCEYFSPVRFDDELELALRVVKLGRKSVTYEVEFRCAGKRIALGRMTAVYCTIADDQFQPRPIPDSVRAKLEERLISP